MEKIKKIQWQVFLGHIVSHVLKNESSKSCFSIRHIYSLGQLHARVCVMHLLHTGFQKSIQRRMSYSKCYGVLSFLHLTKLIALMMENFQTYNVSTWAWSGVNQIWLEENSRMDSKKSRELLVHVEVSNQQLHVGDKQARFKKEVLLRYLVNGDKEGFPLK
jgi:hypothetical protein